MEFDKSQTNGQPILTGNAALKVVFYCGAGHESLEDGVHRVECRTLAGLANPTFPLNVHQAAGQSVKKLVIEPS